VLPSRSRLERWNPDSLTFTGQAVRDGGTAIDNAVTKMTTNIKTMPDTKAWSGDAHTAATSMFERGHRVPEMRCHRGGGDIGGIGHTRRHGDLRCGSMGGHPRGPRRGRRRYSTWQLDWKHVLSKMKLKPKPIILAVALFGFSVFAAIWVIIWLSRGSYLTAAIMLGLTLWALGFAFYLTYATSGMARPRQSVDTSGVLLRPPMALETVFIVATSSAACAAGLYLVFAPLGMVDYMPTGLMELTAFVGCGAMVLFGFPTLIRMLNHGGGNHLRLSPDHFEVWNGQWGAFKRGPWGDIEQILDHPPEGKKPFHEVIVFALPEGRSIMLVADAFMGDTHSLRRWVRFYWQHPEHRDELADGRGLRRLDEQDFTAG
jgi:hypothetical protein